ncbi:MAG: choloylglycine hydrolase family protein [Ruminococcaceae bacterium]|nr:choloylglycine hydrolase family protein [Oscillospiraceae bacterium]
MCTAVSFSGFTHCFGRNLDLECSYGESVAVTPRRYPFSFRCGEQLPRHYAMIGMAHVAAGFPLYYEATNERGLSMAGLNFPQSCVYHPCRAGKANIASFELIPWLLSRCSTLAQARAALETVNVWDESFAPHLPASPLHWLMADKTGALVVESTADGLQIYENDTRVLTNEPPFPFHRENLQQYHALTPEDPAFPVFSRGLGSRGLPGGLDSASRFVRAAFTARHALPGETEAETVSRFFRILDIVAQTRGCCHLGGDDYEETLYSSCCTDGGVYYYATAANRSLTAVDMHRENLDAVAVVTYPLQTALQVERQN